MAVNLNTNSIVDFLASLGQASDYNTRANLARQYGISNYTGTAAQNSQLLGILKNNYTQQSTPATQQTTVTQSQTPAYVQTPTIIPSSQNSNENAQPVNMADLNSLQIQLRNQIQQGLINPKDAWAQLDRMIIGQITGWSGVMTQKQRESYDKMAQARKDALYSNLGTIKTTDGQIGTVNPKTGDIVQTSTKQVSSNTSLSGGTSSSTTARLFDAYTGQPITGAYDVDPNTGAVKAKGTVVQPGAQPMYNSNTGKSLINGVPVTINGQTYYAANQSDADKILNGIVPALDALTSQGLQINPNLNIDDATVAAIFEKAKTLVHPQFAQQVAGIVDDLKRGSQIFSEQYQNEVANQQDAFTQSLANTREESAGAGTIFSGGRGFREAKMQGAQDRNLASLSTSYGSRIGDLSREAEKALGTAGYNASGYQLPSLARYKSSTEGMGGFNINGGIDTKYTPGIYGLGTIPQAEEASALALRNMNINEASKRKTQGLSYTDLYQ